MKKFILVIFVLILISSLIIPHTTYAATVKLSKSKVELKVGDSTTLKLTGATGTIKWTSNNNEIVSISKSGKLTANAEGKATITAKNNNKSYKCYVTVKIVNVKVTVSGALSYLDEASEYLSSIDYIKTVTNKDDTITYTMTKEHQQMILLFLKEYFFRLIDTSLNEKDYDGFCKSYKTNDNVTLIDVYVDKEAYLSSDPDFIGLEETMFMLFLLSSSYQEYSGIKEDDMTLKVNIYDYQAKELIDSFDQDS